MSAPDGSGAVGLAPQMLAPHAVRHHAEHTPDAVALEHVQGDTLTYRQLHAASQQWAAALHHAGVAAGRVVATLVPNRPDSFSLWLGLGWLRAVEAPLNPALKGDLLVAALDGSGAAMLVTDPDGLPVVLDVIDRLPQVRRIVVLESFESLESLETAACGDDVLSAAAGGATPEAEPSAAATGPGQVQIDTAATFLSAPGDRADLAGPTYCDVAALLYTSGTTGRSKGVLVTWASVYQTWSWVPSDAVQPGEGLYCAFPMFHTSGKAALNAALVRGARFVWRDRFSAADLWDDIRRTRSVAACLVGPMLAYVHGQPVRPDDGDNPLRSVLAGPMIAEIAAFEERFGVKVATCYSMTEIGTPLATGWDHGPTATCGRPRMDYPWTEVRVVNDRDEAVGPGEVGELVVRTAEPWALNAGYHHLPDATAAAWRNGWFHSGDAFRYDEEGWFYLVDRMSDAIRRRGENISSIEVETEVRAHPDVVDCAAVGVPAAYGEHEILLVVEVPRPEAFDVAALVERLEQRLPRFMVPRYVRVCGSLPRNETSQRVQKFRLRAEGVTSDTWDGAAALASAD